MSLRIVKIRLIGLWVVWALYLYAMVAMLVFGCLAGSAQVESRAHLGWGGALTWALRMRGVEHGPIVRRGGGGGRWGVRRGAARAP